MGILFPVESFFSMFYIVFGWAFLSVLVISETGGSKYLRRDPSNLPDVRTLGLLATVCLHIQMEIDLG